MPLEQRSSAGAQLMVGLAAIALGIISLAGEPGNSFVLTTIAILAVGGVKFQKAPQRGNARVLVYKICPGFAAAHLPLSRKHEQELFDYYGLAPYWPANIGMFPTRESMYYPGHIITPPKKVGKEEENDTHLRSFHEVKGYFIKATDDSFGHVEDLIIDDSDWQILYVIIDTKNLVPWSKQVMLPIELIDEISFFDKEAKINLKKEAIKDAPDYNPENSISAEYEKVLKDYYGRKMIV